MAFFPDVFFQAENAPKPFSAGAPPRTPLVQEVTRSPVVDTPPQPLSLDALGVSTSFPQCEFLATPLIEQLSAFTPGALFRFLLHPALVLPSCLQVVFTVL